jgi:adenylylsulfate kinase
MSRTMVKLLHADGFFRDEEVSRLYNIAESFKFTPVEYGEELENFNLVLPNVNEIFSRVLGETIHVDEDKSGVFRRPMRNIHFEGFDSLNEWRFAIALEKCTFNLYYHLSGAKTALDAYKFNYKNLFEWDYHTNILLEPNQGIFYRPWCFHSFDGGLIQTYNLISEKQAHDKKLILIMGLPGSGKSTLADNLAKHFNSQQINADKVREFYNDWDFSREGRHRQATRMRKLALLANSEIVFVDFVCPTQTARDYFAADYIIWMDTIKEGRFDDTNKMFEPPKEVNMRIESFDYDIENIINHIKKGI